MKFIYQAILRRDGDDWDQLYSQTTPMGCLTVTGPYMSDLADLLPDSALNDMLPDDKSIASVYVEVTAEHHRYWTDCGYEWDVDFDYDNFQVHAPASFKELRELYSMYINPNAGYWGKILEQNLFKGEEFEVVGRMRSEGIEVREDKSLYRLTEYVNWTVGKISLDGDFTAEQLKDFTWWMENKSCQR